MGVIRYRLRDGYARLHTKYLTSVIFVHINKTGGTSIEKALRLPFQHRTAREIQAAIGRRRWDARFSFTFVRNPWDRVASHYHYRVKTNQTGLRERPVPFTEWVRLAYGERALPYYDQPKMFMPQWEWICDDQGALLVNFVGRFEKLTTDFQEVCRRIGTPAMLPHLKKSERADYREYYDDASAEIVARCFAPDLANLGYTFEQSSRMGAE